MERPRTAREPAVENAEMPAEETVSQFGDVPRKERAVAVEARADDGSGDVAGRRAFLAREARITDEEREQRVKAADTVNEANDQTTNDCA